MAKKQKHFKFNTETSYKADDFIKAPCNDLAYDALMGSPDFAPLTILWGPIGSGKTHLAVMWQKRFDAEILILSELSDMIKDNKIDGKGYYLIDADETFTNDTEEALFHLYNRLKADGGHLLLVARISPENWDVKLPDLNSRLKASPHLVVSLPDEATITVVLAKLFSDRHMNPQPRVMSFIVKRIERSFKNLVALVDWVDQETLRHKRKMTIPLMKSLLEGYHQQKYIKDRAQ